MNDHPPEDAFLDAEVESAIRPYRDLGLSAALLAEMEEQLRAALTADPIAIELIRRVRQATFQESCSIPVPGAAAIPSKAESS